MRPHNIAEPTLSRHLDEEEPRTSSQHLLNMSRACACACPGIAGAHQSD